MIVSRSGLDGWWSVIPWIGPAIDSGIKVGNEIYDATHPKSEIQKEWDALEKAGYHVGTSPDQKVSRYFDLTRREITSLSADQIKYWRDKGIRLDIELDDLKVFSYALMKTLANKFGTIRRDAVNVMGEAIYGPMYFDCMGPNPQYSVGEDKMLAMMPQISACLASILDDQAWLASRSTVTDYGPIGVVPTTAKLKKYLPYVAGIGVVALLAYKILR